MKNFDVTDIRLFLALERTKSMTRAASEMHMAVSSASMRLRALESMYETEFFERTSKGLVLTKEGMVFSDYAKKLLCQTDRMESRLVMMQQDKVHHLKIATNLNASVSFLGRDVDCFLQAHPNVTIELIAFHRNWELLHAVQAGNVDFGITAYTGTHPELCFLPYHYDELVIIYAKKYYQLPEKMTFARVAHHHLVGISGENALQALLEEKMQFYGLTPFMRVKVPNYLSVMEMVSRGYGIAVLPKEVLKFFPSISYSQLDEVWAPRPLRMVYCRERLGTLTQQWLRMMSP